MWRGGKDRQLQGRQRERRVNGEWRLRLTRRLAGAFLFLFFSACCSLAECLVQLLLCVFSIVPKHTHTHTYICSFFFLHVFCGWLNSLKFLLLAERLSKDYNSCLALQDSRFYPRSRAARRRGSHIELLQEAGRSVYCECFFV